MPHNILTGGVPAWYELEPSKDGIALDIKIHAAAMEFLKGALVAEKGFFQQMIRELQKELNLPDFILPEVKNSWGFDEQLHHLHPQGPNWSVWGCQLSIVEDGKGNVVPGENVLAHSLSASLKILFAIMDRFEKSTNYIRPQLLTITQMSLTQGGGGYGLWVRISPELARCISKELKDKGEFAWNMQTMKDAYNHMRPRESHDDDPFRAYFQQPKWVHLNCPGNACCLNPSYSDFGNESLERGYGLTPHNIDDVVQQLTLLMGVANLYYWARAEGF